MKKFLNGLSDLRAGGFCLPFPWRYLFLLFIPLFSAGIVMAFSGKLPAASLKSHAGVLDHSVSGTVTSPEGEPLQGVSVVIKGSSTGTVTDVLGKFELTVPDENAVLVISYVGYITKEFKVGSLRNINIALEPDATMIEEAVVIGYGVQDRRALTSSVSTLKNAAFRELKVSSVEQAMIGQMPGVQVTQNTGHPGAGLRVRVRGTGSISALNEPLYVIDGYPIENTGLNNRVNIMSFINPNDIETITVLKDAASTSIYGSRGSNGVVLITTKTGSKGRTSIEVNSWYGVSNIPERGRFEMMNAEEFAQFRIETIEDQLRGQGILGDKEKLTGPTDSRMSPTQQSIFGPYFGVTGEGTDWFEFITRKNAPTMQHNVTIKSGNEKMRSLLSFDYYKVEGVVKNSDYTRGSLRANVDVDISKRIKAGIRLNPVYNFRNTGDLTEGEPWAGGMVSQALASSPIATPYNSDGTRRFAIVHSPENWIFPNPLNVYDYKIDTRTDFRILSNAYVDIELVDGLHFKTNAGIDFNFARTKFWYPTRVGGRVAAGGGSIVPTPGAEILDATRNELYNWLVENTLNYNKTIAEDHYVDLLLGQTIQRQDYYYIGAFGRRFPNDFISEVSAAQAGEFRDGTSGTDNFRYALQSWFGRVMYSYKGKYDFTATIRRDGSSRYSPDTRWGTFPSVSLGWHISEEPFFQALDQQWLSDLKIRGSYGITGNNNTGSSFAYIASLSSNNYVLGNQLANGYSPNFADPSLAWEKNREFDLGLDISVFSNRLSLTADYYRRVTYDLLLNRPVPVISGGTATVSNIGELENKGFEFGISSRNIEARDLTWNTSANISFNRNKVLALYGNDDPLLSGSRYDGTTRTAVGEPIAMYFGFIIEGVYRDEAEALASGIDRAYAGGLKVKDVNGDGTISDADRDVMGNPHPDFTFGLNNTFRYKQFDLFLQISGTVGNSVLFSSYEHMRNLDGVFNAVKDAQNRWKSPEEPGNGIYPRAYDPTGMIEYVRLANSNWVFDATHARINNLTVGYSLPGSLLGKSKVFNSVRLYLSGQNLLIISKTPMNNPDASYTSVGDLKLGWMRNTYPLARTMTVGVNITL